VYRIEMRDFWRVRPSATPLATSSAALTLQRLNGWSCKAGASLAPPVACAWTPEMPALLLVPAHMVKHTFESKATEEHPQINRRTFMLLDLAIDIK
jgi:hypothetical protein